MTPHWATTKVASSKVQELLALDFTEPTTQQFPQSSAEMTALGLPAPVSIYDFQEAAGNALDHVGSNDLSPINSPKQGEVFTGLWDGSDLTSYKGCHFQSCSKQRLQAANAGVFDYGVNDSFAMLFFWRPGTGFPLAHNAGTQGCGIIYKRNLAAATGYQGFLLGGGNALQFRLEDTVVGVSVVSLISNLGLGGAAPEAILWVVNRTTNTMHLYQHTGLSDSTDITGVATLSSTQTFYFGSPQRDASFQICYAAMFEGANAESLDATDLATFWNYAQEPTGLLTTSSHSSNIGCDVNTGPLIADYASDQFPHAYDAVFSHAGKLGVQCRASLTNLVQSSDRFYTVTWAVGTEWSATNVTPSNVVGDADVSPRGLSEAGKCTATNANGYLGHLFTSVASTVYTFGVYIKRHSTMVGDVTGRLIAYDATGAAEVASLVYTATATWQWIQFTWTSNVGQISTEFRIEIDNNADAICLLRATAVEADWIYPIFSESAAAIAGATDFEVAGVDGQYARGGAGEIEVVAACKDSAVTSIERFLADIRNGNANNDRRSMSVRSDEKMRAEAWDSSAVSAGSVDSAVYAWNVERTCRMQWRASGFVPLAPGNRVANVVSGNIVGGIAGAWTSMNQAETLYVGSDGQASPANQLNGVIATLKVFNQPRSS